MMNVMPKTKTSNLLYDKALDEAIQRIYRVYGTNLAAFFRDVEDPASHGKPKYEIQAHLKEMRRAKSHLTHSSC